MVDRVPYQAADIGVTPELRTQLLGAMAKVNKAIEESHREIDSSRVWQRIRGEDGR
jgi:hypothetical protein